MLRNFKLLDLVLFLGLGLMAIGVSLNLKEKVASPEVVVEHQKTSPTVAQVNSKVQFDIGGKVINPGVYQLPLGSRIGDALTVAGGLNGSADRDWVEKNLNRAEIIKDGEKIYIPAVNEVLIPSQIPKPGVLGLATKNEKININTAMLGELDKLSGIGPVMAQRIIDYREKNGGFKNQEEIKMVSGVGEKLYEKIKDEISI